MGLAGSGFAFNSKIEQASEQAKFSKEIQDVFDFLKRIEKEGINRQNIDKNLLEEFDRKIYDLSLKPDDYADMVGKILDDYFVEPYVSFNSNHALDLFGTEDAPGETLVLETILFAAKDKENLQKNLDGHKVDRLVNRIIDIFEKSYDKHYEVGEKQFEDSQKKTRAYLQSIDTDSVTRAEFDAEIKKIYEMHRAHLIDSGSSIDNLGTFEEYRAREYERLQDAAGIFDHYEGEYYNEFVEEAFEKDADNFFESSYPDAVIINRCIEFLAPYGTKKTIDRLLPLISKFGANVTKKMAYTMSSIDAGYAAHKMMSHIGSIESKQRRTSTDPNVSEEENWLCQTYSRLLHRLEFGRIPVSASGVEYLGRMYDLKEHNNEGYHIERLTVDGHVGIFDDEFELIKYFNLGDLTDGQTKIVPEVLDFTYETLFFATEDETSAERAKREKYLQEFKKHYAEIASDLLFQETGVRLNNLTFREQGWFLIYFNQADETTKERLRSFVASHGENAIRVFLSLEQQGDMADKVLELQEKFGSRTEEFARVLADYASVIDIAHGIQEAIEASLRALRLPGVSSQVFLQKLLARATGYLAFAHDQVVSREAKTYADIQRGVVEDHRGLDVQSCREAVISSAVIELANVLSDTQVRQVFDDAYRKVSDPTIATALDRARTYVTPTPTAKTSPEAIRDLAAFYNDRIKFETYELNERQQAFDMVYLETRLSPDGRTLDLGCGTGRHLVPLLEKNYSVEGIDFSERHAAVIKKDHPEARVEVGDWKKTPYQDAAFSSVYSLGRSILHESRLLDQHALFAEVHRILKPGGTFHIDIPNRDRGNYHELVRAYADTMKKRGIDNTRYGSIYDSPDGKHFATRYAYSVRDIEELAEAHGFTVIDITHQSLETGKGDENIYITLQKNDMAAPSQE